MATLKQTITQGKRIVTNNRARSVLEKDLKSPDTDDSQEETAQSMNAAAG